MLNKTQLNSIDKFICDTISEVNKKLETNTCNICNYFTYEDDRFHEHMKSFLHKYKEKQLKTNKTMKVILDDDFTDEKAIWLENRNLKIKLKELKETVNRLCKISDLNQQIISKQYEMRTRK